MDWQLGVVAAIVAAAALYLVRQTWRTWAGRGAGCGKGCACSAAKEAHDGQVTIIPSDQLTLRRR